MQSCGDSTCVRAAPITRTTSPIVTGASVLAIKYRDGVMMMSDTLGSYGSLSRFTTICRMRKINQHTLVGASGDYSDFQYIIENLNALITERSLYDDGILHSAKDVHSYLRGIMYAKRSKADPLWNQLIVVGFHEQESYLGLVDLYGSTYEDPFIATGFGTYLAMPLLRKLWRPNMTEDEARALLERAMTVLLYRDCRTINRIQVAKITTEGAQISQPYNLQTNWSYKQAITVE